jgi:CMP-N-acetylneuraminic acid synthetase
MEEVCPKKPLVTVYLPSHNYGRYVEAAIESVLKQTMTDWELLLIDDGSTDNTSDIFQCYADHPKIQTFKTDKIGLPKVCNFALEKSNGKYIIRLDGDDIFDENILLVLSNHLQNNPEIALVFPDYYLFDANGEIYLQARIRQIFQQNHMLDMPPHGACTMVRTNVIHELNGYREDLGAQDGFDLWTRIIKKYKCANVNLPLFYYRRHDENLTTNKHRIFNARQQIKRDSVESQLKQSRPIIAVIPIRKYYDFVTNLWKQTIHDKSLLERDIEICLNSSLFDFVVVTCDDPEAEEVVNSINDPRLKFFAREPKSTLRTSSIVPTLENITKKYDPDFNGITVLRYIQTPFVAISTLEEAVYTLVFSGADSACGVEPINSDLFKRNSYGLQALNSNPDLSSDFDVIYRDVKSCLATYNRNFKKGSLTGAQIVSFEVSAAECFFIASPKDLRIAKLLADDTGVHNAI